MIDIWLAVGFLIILFVSFKRIASFIDASLNAKIASIKENINEAKKIKQEAQQLLLDTKNLVESLPEQKRKLISQMEKEVETLKEENLILHKQELKDIELDFEAEMTKKEFAYSMKMKKAASDIIISHLKDYIAKKPKTLVELGIKLCDVKHD